MYDERHSLQGRTPNSNPSLREHEVRSLDRPRVGQCTNRFLERHAVLPQVGGGLSIVPLEVADDHGSHGTESSSTGVEVKLACVEIALVGSQRNRRKSLRSVKGRDNRQLGDRRPSRV